MASDRKKPVLIPDNMRTMNKILRMAEDLDAEDLNYLTSKLQRRMLDQERSNSVAFPTPKAVGTES